MPRSNDNWEKLVNAVLRRKELRALAYCESMDSVSDSFSSCTSFSGSSSICYRDQSPVSLWPNELSVKKHYMLCARELYISWKDSPMYWTWTSLPESRFSEVAELRNVCWLDIVGIMQSQILSPCTNYTAYLVYKLAKRHYGLDYPTKARIRFVENGLPEIEVHTSTVYIVPQRHVKDGQIPRTRSDGWMEIKIGTFLTGEIDNDIDIYMQLSEVEGYGWKKGLIIEGIEVRPNEEETSVFAHLPEACTINILSLSSLKMHVDLKPFLVFKLSQGHYGLDCTSKATILCVKIGCTNEIEGVTTSNVYIVQPNFQDLLRRDRGRRLANRRGCVAQRRSDGWMEIELGTFFSGENHDIHMQLSEVCDFGWKKGLIVQGIEVRPKEEVS